MKFIRKFIRTVSERFPNGRAEVELNYEASLKNRANCVGSVGL
jgi:hypothetical protein